MKKIQHLSICLLLTINYLSAQTISKREPRWYYDKPESTLNTYYVGKGYAPNRDNAKKSAYYDFMKQLSQKQSFTIDVLNKTTMKMESKTINKTENFSENFESEIDVITKYDKIRVENVIEADFFYARKNKEYEYAILFAMPTTSNSKGVIKEKRLNFTWRSAILPGLGQFHNYERIKGFAFLSGAAALLGTSLYCEAQRSDKIKKVNQTFDTQRRIDYQNDANKWKSTRDIMFLCTGAFYLWNIIDASTGKNNRFVYNENKKLQYIAFADKHSLQFGFKLKL